MKILFLRGNGGDFVGAPRTYHGFEQAVGKIAGCRWAGRGWPLHRPNESMDMTVKRVMPDADWVIDKDNGFKVPKNRGYRVGYMASDLHGKASFKVGTPRGFVKLINSSPYDAVFLKYCEVHGVNCAPDIFLTDLKAKTLFLPWSVDPKEYYPREKTIDVAFLGTHGRRYPIRKSLWKGLPTFCGKHQLELLMRSNPPGKTFKRYIPRLLDEGYFVGDRYRKALGGARIFVFGCSQFRYPLQKFFEVMASGALVMSNAPASADKLHFKDGLNFVNISKDNWREKLLYYTTHREEAEEIAMRGRETVLKYHTHDVRANEFLEMLKW